MSNLPQTAGTPPVTFQRSDSEADPLEIVLEEFGKEAGVRVGDAIATEIHQDPKARQAAAAGVGIGVGIVLGTALLNLAIQYSSS